MGAALCCDGGGSSTSGKMAHLDQTPVAASLPPDDLSEKNHGDSHEDQVVPELHAMVSLPSTAAPVGSGQPPPEEPAKVPTQDGPEIDEPKGLPPETDAKPNLVLEQPKKPPSEQDKDYVVALQRRDKKLGVIVFNRPGEEVLRLGAIKKGGVIDEWNTCNPQRPIEPRSIIVEVNGFVKSEEMRAVIADEGVNNLQLRIRPAA
mmetsp:Transcript_43262/g.78741  ORF Transcript_43262/g.78741 Transcript_43262/m.78741 type:complete len:204 (-) Transcript_43262:104-715(-)